MFTPEQYLEKAARYTELARHGNTPSEVREFKTRERSFTMLADNKQWLADNDDKLADLDEMVHVSEHSGASEGTLAEEGRILQCLGAALLMEWNTLPTGLQRDLFDNAGSTGELLDTTNRSLPAQAQGWPHEDGKIVSSSVTDTIDYVATIAQASPPPPPGTVVTEPAASSRLPRCDHDLGRPQGDLPARRGPAVVPARGARRADRAVRPEEDHAASPVSAVP